MNDLSVNDYLTNLETDKEELVNNLNERGVDASTDETFTSLTKKVKTIGEGSMPYATEDIAGVIKVGKNLKMDNDGKLNASFDDYPTYEVILTSDFMTDTLSGGRALANADKNILWDMYHWAEEITQESDYCVTYTFKNQYVGGSNKTFKKYFTQFYSKGTLPSEYLFAVCFGYSANGAIINGHGKSIGSIVVANLYFRFDPNANIISLSVSHDSTGESLVTAYALAKDNRSEYIPTGDYHPATKLYVDTKINEVGIQFIVMPEATSEYYGKVFQYIGETTATYIKGHFYTCVSDGAEEPTYRWTELSFGGGDGDSTPEVYVWSTQTNLGYLSQSTDGNTSPKYPVESDKNISLGDFLIEKYNYAKSEGKNIIIVLNVQYNSYVGTINTDDAGGGGYIFFSGGAKKIMAEVALSEHLATYVSNISLINDALAIDNTTAYTPTEPTHPATKGYVDDQIGNINAVLATLVDIEEGE